MNEKKKIGMSGLNWFLSIIGLLFFSSLIFLPPIFRALLKEDDSSLHLPKQEIVKATTICTKVEGKETTEYIIDSTDDQIDLFAQSISRTYSEKEIEAIENCNKEASLYQGLSGFHHGCRIDEGKIIIESRVQISEYKNEPIPISFNLEEKASVLKTSFLSTGFQCETKQHEQ